MRPNIEIKLPRDKVSRNLLLAEKEEKMNESLGLQYLFRDEVEYVKSRLMYYIRKQINAEYYNLDMIEKDIDLTYHKRYGDIFLRASVDIERATP